MQEMSNLELISLWPETTAAKAIVLGLAGGGSLSGAENAADAYVCIADVHEASTPNAYRRHA